MINRTNILYMIIIIISANMAYASSNNYALKNTITISGKLSYKYKKTNFDNEEKLTYSYYFAPEIGYFIIDKLRLSITPYIYQEKHKDSVQSWNNSAKAFALELMYYYPIYERFFINLGSEIAFGTGKFDMHEISDLPGTRIEASTGITIAFGDDKGGFITLLLSYNFVDSKKESQYTFIDVNQGRVIEPYYKLEKSELFGVSFLSTFGLFF